MHGIGRISGDDAGHGITSDARADDRYDHDSAFGASADGHDDRFVRIDGQQHDHDHRRGVAAPAGDAATT